VDGVKPAGFFFSQAHGFNGDYFEACFVNSCKDFTLLAATNRVGLDDCESVLKCHEKFLQNIKPKMPG